MRGNIENLQRVLRLSKTMRSAASESDWERVVLLEADRRPIIERSFSEEPIVEDGRVGQMMADILEVDREVMTLANQARDTISAELSELNRGKQVIKAYCSVAS